MKLRRLTIATILLVLVAGTALALLWDRPGNDRARPSAADNRTGLPWDAPSLQRISRFLDARWRGEQAGAPHALQMPTEGVYLAARGDGLRLSESWGFGTTAAQALGEALDDVRQELGEGAAQVTSMEIFVAIGSEPVDPIKERRRLHSNIRRGVFGLEIGRGETRERFSPTYVLASNRKNKRLIELYGRKHGLDDAALRRLPYRFLLGPQLLVSMAPGQDRALPRAQLMERGNRYVPLSEVTQAGVQRFAEQMEDWMFRSLHPDGRMTYLYWPSRGEEAEGRDNLIRQFMATIALGRAAAENSDPTKWKRSAQNIDYNLATYYHVEGPYGLVELHGKIKLGALALATLAIVEHRDRARWAQQEAALRRTIQSLWREDGSFRTFYKPADRNDVQNFYPGEALLLWATLYAQAPDEVLLERFMKSFRYYRSWHLDPEVANRRNPAFIPWHTQACYIVWRETRSEELRDFIFEMNDWLLGVQQWDGVDYPDTRGRFYDPVRPFGRPHASATGVYLEGLIDAYQLAHELGDEDRARRYALSIRRGLRSSMQLQFADDLDMFYVHEKEAVRGGLRTTVYDNQIRCDNVQHTLMGTRKILESDVLGRQGATSE